MKSKGRTVEIKDPLGPVAACLAAVLPAGPYHASLGLGSCTLSGLATACQGKRDLATRHASLTAGGAGVFLGRP